MNPTIAFVIGLFVMVVVVFIVERFVRRPLCKKCGAEAMPNQTRALIKAHNTIDGLQAEIERLEKLVYVPGLWKCARCQCGVVSSTMHAGSGLVKANNAPQPCPNGCGPMWRVTERDAGNELADRMELTRNNALDQAAQLAMDIPLKSGEERHDYRWSDTYKCAALEISNGIRSLKTEVKPRG